MIFHGFGCEKWFWRQQDLIRPMTRPASLPKEVQQTPRGRKGAMLAQITKSQNTVAHHRAIGWYDRKCKFYVEHDIFHANVGSPCAPSSCCSESALTLAFRVSMPTAKLFMTVYGIPTCSFPLLFVPSLSWCLCVFEYSMDAKTCVKRNATVCACQNQFTWQRTTLCVN